MASTVNIIAFSLSLYFNCLKTQITFKFHVRNFSPSGESAFGPNPVMLGDYSMTLWDARDLTWIGHMQGKCTTHCTTAQAQKLSVFLLS